ncbi:MAG: Fic family protein [Sedimenticola sp.]
MPAKPKVYPNTTVFINKLGIVDAQTLGQVEGELSALRSEEYRNAPPAPSFDLNHLKAIHRQLFSDLYDWAGGIRGYDMVKGICAFTPGNQIETYARQLYNQLTTENYLIGLSPGNFLSRIAYYYDITNRLHPFPEGNGRTQRLFIEHLAAEAGFFVDWTKVQPWQIIEIAEQSFKGHIEPTCSMFEEITSHEG